MRGDEHAAKGAPSRLQAVVAGAPSGVVPISDNPFLDRNGNFLKENLNGQDMMVMLTQGVIADRALETLGESDKGVVMYRRVLLEQIEKIERGEAPLGVVRDTCPLVANPYTAHPSALVTPVSVPVAAGVATARRRSRRSQTRAGVGMRLT